MKNIFIIISCSTFILNATMSLSQDLSITKSDTSFFQVVDKIENYFAQIKESPDTDANIKINEKHFKRWKWFWEQRVDRNGSFKPYSKKMQNLARQNSYFSSLKAASSVQWTSLGPSSAPTQDPSCNEDNNGVCQVTSVWSNGSDIYVGLNGGGLWKRNGTSWNNLTDEIMCFSVNDIAVDNNGKIYIATGYKGQNGSMMGGDIFGFGVFYSTDDGDTWVTDKMSSIPDEDLYILKVIIHPTQQNTVYALSRKTVYKSIDGGNNWTDTNAPSLANNQLYRDLVLKESDPNTLFLCSDGWDQTSAVPGNIYKSSNAGSTWQSTTNLADNLKYGSNTPHWLEFATTPDDASAIYIIYRDASSNRSTLEKSTDEGISWSTLADRKYIYSRAHMMYELEVSPTNSDEIYVGGVSQYRYNPSTNNFDPIGTNLHADLRDFHIVSSGGTTTIYQGNDGGVYSSTNGGNTWTDLTNGIQGALFYGIAISETNPNLCLGGVGDCGTHLFNGTSWSHMCMGGDGGTCLINHTNTNNMFGMINSSVRYSTNGGGSWNPTYEEIMDYNKPLIQHPTLNKVYLAAVYNWKHTIRYTEDYGISWQSLMTGWSSGRIFAMAISESNPSTIYISRTEYNSGIPSTIVQKTTNEGSTWSDITSNLGNVVNEAKVTNIEIHPTNPDIIWISFGGMSDGNKVFLSINGGTSWSNITYNLENVPVMDIVYDYGNHQLYIATDIGPYYLEYDGTSWTKLGVLPQTVTTSLALSETTGKLFASTWGRGLWETDIEGHCYDGSNQYVSSNTTWTSDLELCNNLVIQSGTTTLQSKLKMPFEATIIIKSGATLNVDGGEITNADIIVESGGSLNILNNGIIEQNNEDDLVIQLGGLFQNSLGEIRLLSGY